MKSKVLLIFFVLLLQTNYSFAQEGKSAKSDELIEKYITAFNGGEETMKTFLLENVSASSLKERPIEMRLNMYRQMHGDVKDLTLNKIVETSPSSVTALISASNDAWLLFTFLFESKTGNKIEGIRIEQTDPPDSSATAKMTEPEAVRTIAQFLDQQAKKDIFSGSIVIAKDGTILFKSAYGLANKEFKVRNRPGTKFNLGSINKIFTQIAIGQLFEQGKLSLSDLIIKFLPGYPNNAAARKVTIRHLLDMTSGICDFFGEKFENRPKDKFRTIGDFLGMFAGDSLKFEPGTERQYSNGGFIVLGAIIEKASGQNYFDYVKDNIFKPAGMLNTDSYEADIPVPNLAEGYTRDSSIKPWKRNIYTRPARGSSAGGGYSTAEDLLKFTDALEKGVFFKDVDTWSTLRGEPSGSNDRKQNGLGIYGGAPGINSGIESNIGRGYTAIVMANYDPPAAADAMKKIRGILKRVR